MASDRDFNRKSFTTGHTGFSVPFTTWPDRVDVPKNAARSLRYLDRFVTVTQGAAFFATELLAQAEGLERGPAGNTSLAAAVAMARELPADDILVVTETEYTGAGKTPWAQLQFAKAMGVDITTGADAEIPGERIVLPSAIDEVRVTDINLDTVRETYIRMARERVQRSFTQPEVEFLREDARLNSTHARALARLG